MTKIEANKIYKYTKTGFMVKVIDSYRVNRKTFWIVERLDNGIKFIVAEEDLVEVKEKE